MFLVGLLMLSVLQPVAGWASGWSHLASGDRTHVDLNIRRVVLPRMAWTGNSDLGAGAGNSQRDREIRFREWLEENGVHMSAQASWGRAAHPLRIEGDTFEDFEPSGRGLIARKSITQGETIVRINTKLVMTKELAQERLGAAVVPADMNEYLAIALLLMHERSLGSSSTWAPYIDLLPSAEEVGQSFVWSESELELLEGSGTLDATIALKEKLQREYADLKAKAIPLLRARSPTPPATADDKPAEDPLGFSRFEWAMSMLFSRGVNLREMSTLAMVPYADLLNHSPYVNSYFHVSNVPLSKEKEVCLYADRAYASNDQVLISYGQKSNSELITLYGFVVDRNLFDQVELSVTLPTDDPRYDEKVAFLEQQRLKPSLSFPLLIDRYSTELMQYLRLACVRPTDGPLDSYRYSEPFSQEVERAALLALRDGCVAALDRYPQTEEEDMKLMEDGVLFTSLPKNARMAIKLRRNEKRILQRTIGVVDTTMRSLAGERVEPLAPGFGW